MEFPSPRASPTRSNIYMIDYTNSWTWSLSFVTRIQCKVERKYHWPSQGKSIEFSLIVPGKGKSLLCIPHYCHHCPQPFRYFWPAGNLPILAMPAQTQSFTLSWSKPSSAGVISGIASRSRSHIGLWRMGFWRAFLRFCRRGRAWSGLMQIYGAFCAPYLL